MDGMLKIGLDGVFPFLPSGSLDDTAAVNALRALKNGSGAGKEFLGWLRLPETYDRAEFARIEAAGKRIYERAQAFVVIGIGGSYLGARAALELLRSSRHNEARTEGPEVYFIGNGISGDDIAQVLDLVRGKELYLNVISKSGTTLEPALAFRIFRSYLEDTYGKDGARARIFCTTDRARGVLKGIADREGYECFVIPDDIGGRYSVLTPVGLLPLAAAGVDIARVMAGAAAQMQESLAETAENPSVIYAAARQALYRMGKKVEVLSYPGENARFLAEWWKQLYGESEGKNGLGIFPASCELTADLHSLGQYIQDGERILLETMLRFTHSMRRVEVPRVENDEDGLNYVAGRDYDEIFACAAEGIRRAHISGGVPCMELIAERPDEETFGALVYFFETACGISGYLQGVNPFDQPGVEEYKKNMFALLGKQ